MSGVSDLNLRLSERFQSFAAIPLVAGVAIVGGLVGAVSAVGAAVLLGRNKEVNEFSFECFNAFSEIFSMVNSASLMVINPDFKVKRAVSFFKANVNELPLYNKATEFAGSENFLKKHVASRLTQGVYLVAAIVARVADMALGLVSAPLSLLTLGLFNPLNNFAINHLRAGPGIVLEIFRSTILIINPWAEFPNTKI